ncbi:hypothetical protein [Asanoa iriomotensis]|uniref:Uncharacterized protein n=1 Tax=Asanoa iriomotensis TaxID=234613 RepID=A0ABQ4C3D3_9ACTN|nr:hypothetical protein [Asanoa iriomotensis]GIF57291.1 hypothetical protein Air01nite_33860 [Asanoa iriomotensis]
MQLTPKKVLALILGIGLPVAIGAGWVLGQRGAVAGGPSGGSGAMGNAPREEVPTPAAQYDVYDKAPLVVPMASTGPVTRSGSAAAPKTSAAPHPTATPTVVPEDHPPSPGPSPTESEATPEPSAGTPDKTD